MMVFAEILPGNKTLREAEDDDDPLMYFNMSTVHLDFLSSYRSPQWLDQSTVCFLLYSFILGFSNQSLVVQ